jgi:TonB family protein
MAEWKDDIEKYRRGELSAKEMHELEKRALSDPFLADALEGIGTISEADLATDIAELNRAIKPKKRVIFTPLRIAAGVVVLITAGTYLFWPSELPTQMAEVTGEQATEKTANPDSLSKTQPADQLTLTEETKGEETQETNSRENLALKKTEPSSTTAAKQKSDAPASDEAQTKESEVAPAIANSNAATSASKLISGTVTGAEDGLPLPGVSIKVKGTSLGTTTDLTGHYSLSVPDSTSLVFSFVGMQTSESDIDALSKLDVKMNEDVSQLNEVVITRSAIPRPANLEPVVILAEPVGGIKAYDQYMEDNLRYPQQAVENNVRGRVVVEFNVGVDGSLNNFVVMRSLGYGCEDEVIRLVKEGPNWRPTTEDNKPVETSVRVRMKFDPAKMKKKR